MTLEQFLNDLKAYCERNGWTTDDSPALLYPPGSSKSLEVAVVAALVDVARAARLEKTGHNSWCSWLDDKAKPCDCGLGQAFDRLAKLAEGAR